jgi:hypothetical protein
MGRWIHRPEIGARIARALRIKTATPIVDVHPQLVAVMIAEDLTMLRDVRERDDWNSFAGTVVQGASVGNFSKVTLVNTANAPAKLGVLDQISVVCSSDWGVAIEPALGGAVQTFSLDPRIGYQTGSPFFTDQSTPVAAPTKFAELPTALVDFKPPNGIIIPPGFMVSVFPVIVNTGIVASFFFRQLAAPGN